MACRPPYYILVSNSTLSNPTQAPLSNSLRHPIIQYHYKDDSALALLPQHPDERVLILDCAAQHVQPTVHSISDTLVVTGLKVEEAPGAAAAASPDVMDNKDDKMFIVETISDDQSSTPPHEERKSAQETLSQFKHRNDILRRALLYPSDIQPDKPISQLASPPTSRSAFV